MPPGPEGGPWPSEWMALFERWVQTGDDATVGHHVELAVPSNGTYKVEAQFGGKLKISAEVTVPTAGGKAWFDLVSADATAREYTLYREPEYPPPANPQPLTLVAQDIFKKGSLTKITVNDSQGQHDVAL